MYIFPEVADTADQPPSYCEVVSSDAWSLVVPRLPRDLVLKLSKLPNRRLAGLAQQCIWTNPRLFWSEDPDEAFVSLKKLVAVVGVCQEWHHRTARPSPARFTTILDLSGICPETFSDNLPTSWIEDLLSSMPNLRCISFSRSSLLEESHLSVLTRSVYPQLAMLDFSNCKGLVFSQIISIPRWAPNLWYLDLSDNELVNFLPTSKTSFKSFLSQLPHLRVLCWRGCSQMGVSATAILDLHLSSKIGAMDLRDPQSLLTDSFHPWNEFTPRYCDSSSSLQKTKSDDCLVQSFTIESPFNKSLQARDMKALVETRIEMASVRTIQSQKLVGRLEVLTKMPYLEVGWWLRPPFIGLSELSLAGPWENLKVFSKLIKQIPLTDFDCGDVAMPIQNSNCAYLKACMELLQAIIDCPTLQKLRCPHHVLTGNISNVLSAAGVEKGSCASPVCLGATGIPLVDHPFVLSIPEISLTHVDYADNFGLTCAAVKIVLHMAAEWEKVCSVYMKNRSEMPTILSARMDSPPSYLKAQPFCQTKQAWSKSRGEDVEAFFQKKNWCVRLLTLELKEPKSFRQDEEDHVFSFFDDGFAHDDDFISGFGKEAARTIKSQMVSLSSLDPSNALRLVRGLHPSQLGALEKLQQTCRIHKLKSGGGVQCPHGAVSLSGTENERSTEQALCELTGLKSLSYWRGDVFAIAHVDKSLVQN